MKTTKKERTSVVAAAEYWKRHKKPKDETSPEWHARWEGGLGLENVRLNDLGAEPLRPEPYDYPKDFTLPKWSDDRGMLEWICRMLDIEDEFHASWERAREAVMMDHNSEQLAIQDLEVTGKRDRLIAIMNSGKELSAELRSYFAALLEREVDEETGKKKPTPVTTRKTHVQKLADDFPIWIADRDYPRICDLWHKHYEKESKSVGKKRRKDRAMEMALSRWVGANVSATVLHRLVTRLEARMKVSLNDPKRF